MPVPDDRKKYANFGQSVSCLTIELLFSDKKLNAYVEDFIVIEGVTLKKIKNDKKINFANSVSNFDAKDFKNFEPLFEQVKEIIDSEYENTE